MGARQAPLGDVTTFFNFRLLRLVYRTMTSLANDLMDIDKRR